MSWTVARISSSIHREQPQMKTLRQHVLNKIQQVIRLNLQCGPVTAAEEIKEDPEAMLARALKKCNHCRAWNQKPQRP